MKYLIQGWQKFDFVLSPDEFKRILEPYHMVVPNAHVPLDYVESFLDEYMAKYEQLYRFWESGEKFIWQRDYQMIDNKGAVTSNLAKCKYGRIHEYEGKKYKSPDFDEPVVVISPFALYFYQDSHSNWCVSTAYSHTQLAENIIGMQIAYPKNIQFGKRDNWKPLQSTSNLGGYGDYAALKKTIMAMTKPLTIMIHGEERRTRIRVSPQAKEMLQRHYTFCSGDIQVK